MQDVMKEVKKVMAEKKIKPSQLKKKTPLSKSTVSNLLQRNACPRLDTFVYICEALNECPCRFLYGFDCGNLRMDERSLLSKYNRLTGDFQDSVQKIVDDLLLNSKTQKGDE